MSATCAAVAVAAVAVPSTPTPDADQVLLARLAPFADYARRVGFMRFKQASHVTKELFSPRDVHHHVLTAAFEAFLALGGDPAQPDAFAWATNEAAMQKATLAQLRHNLVGRTTEVYDLQLRSAMRRDAVCVDAFRWDVWTSCAPVFDGLAPEPHRRRPGRKGVQQREFHETSPQTYAEREQQHAEVAAFEEALRGVTDSETFEWMIERFRDGVPQAEQVDRYIAAHPEYAGPGGRKRVEDLISQRISRGRRRAAAALGREWAELATAVTA